MKKTILSVFLFYVFVLCSCVRNNAKNSDKKASDSLNFNSETLTGGIRISPKDTIDYSKIEISKDTIDLALFNMILGYESFSESKLLKNVEILVNKGANPNAVIEYQYSVRKLGTYIPIVKHFYGQKYRTYTANSTPFHEAVNTGNDKLVKTLIDLNADVNAPSRSAVYPIDLAVSNDHVKIINLLIEHDCDVSKADLSLSQNIEIIKRLVKLGANPKTINIDFALSDENLLKRVLQLGPNLNSQEIEFSVLFNNPTILDMLLKAGLGSEVKGKFPDNCPLVYGAIKYGDINTIKRLKEAGINLKLKCKSGSSDNPLFFSIYHQKPEIIKYLLETEKFSPNLKDWTQKSALLIAANTNNDEIIYLLLDAGASIEYAGYFNKTPLMYAVDYDYYISGQTLIERGANLNYKNKYGETPLTVAIEKHNFAMIKLLKESGAKTNITIKGMTMAEYAKSVEAPNMIIDYFKK